VDHYSPEGSQFALTLTCIARAIWSSGSSRIKQCRRIATRDDKLAADYLAFIKLPVMRIWLHAYESAPKSTATSDLMQESKPIHLGNQFTWLARESLHPFCRRSPRTC
jgi:hypothetical protein